MENMLLVTPEFHDLVFWLEGLEANNAIQAFSKLQSAVVSQSQSVYEINLSSIYQVIVSLGT